MTGIVNQTGARSGIIGTIVGTPAGVPTNVVAYRASGESTPDGFSEYTSVRGRMVVGLQSGGADAGTVGTAYTTAQDKSKSIAHTHTVASHNHKRGDNVTDVTQHNNSHIYGHSGTFTMNEQLNNTGRTPATRDNSLTSSEAPATDSQGGTVVTSDILAYIQLMVIKKD